MFWANFEDIPVDAHVVAPNLSVGAAPPSELKKHGYGIVVLCAEEHQNVKTDVPTIHLPLFDTEAEGVQTVSAANLHKTVSALAELRKKQHVLVTCFAGKNRSAFVAALVLVKGGWTPAGAIERIRNTRVLPPHLGKPLSNRRFVKLIHDYGRRRT